MSDELKTVIGRVLKRHREERGWSQMKLAMEANLHLNALGGIERGERNPNLQSLFLICRALGVSVSELMAEVEREKPEIK